MEIQRLTDVETQRLKTQIFNDPEILRLSHSEIHRFRDLETQRFIHSESQRLRDSGFQRFRDSEIRKLRRFRVSET